jgi:hypothetical protein
MGDDYFRILESSPALERAIVTPDRILAKEVTITCENCDEFFFRGRVEEGHAQFLVHWKERHGGS